MLPNDRFMIEQDKHLVSTRYEKELSLQSYLNKNIIRDGDIYK